MTVTASTTAEDQVRAAYARTASKPGEFAKITTLRYFLAIEGLRGTTAQDDALTALYRAGVINLVPGANQQALIPAQRALAVHVGGEAKHLISIPAR